MKKMILKIYTPDEFCGNPVDYARIQLDENLIGRILLLAAEAERLNVYKITEFHSAGEFLSADWDAEPDGGRKIAVVCFEGKVDCVTLNVTNRDFFWSGNYKHTNVHWESESIPLGELNNTDSIDNRETV